MSRKLTTKDFIEKAKNIHGDKYDYSKVIYNGNKQKICIICPIHGEFWQRPNDHLNGNGCPKCSGRQRNTTDEFITKANYVHNHFFSYKHTEYKGANQKVVVTCPIHGDFSVKANNHLLGYNCPSCSKSGIKHNIALLPKNGNNTKKISPDTVISRIHVLFGEKYNTDKINYINNSTKIELYCNEYDCYGIQHGSFKITPSHLFMGQGCPKCGKNYKLTTEEFIQRCKIIHDNFYDYPKTEYKSTHRNVTITCPIHGDFKQSPANHLRGQGCPKCDVSLLENEIAQILTENKINYIQQATFPWLKYEKNLFLDFYLPDFNIAIECQGEQHFRPIPFSTKINADDLFQLNSNRDIAKHDLCQEHGINILYYSKTNVEYRYHLYTDKNDIIQMIKN